MNKPSYSNANPVAAAFKSCRGAFTSVGVTSCIINLLMLTGPLFMLQIYDRVLTSRSISTLLALALLVAALFCFYGIFELIRTRLLVRIGRRVEEQLSLPAFNKILEHQAKKADNAGTRPLKDLIAVRKYLSGSGPAMLFDMPWAPAYLAVIYLMHPLLGIAATVAVVTMFVIALCNDLLTRKPLANANNTSSAALAAAEENRMNADIIRVLGMAPAMRQRWLAKENEALSDHSRGMDLSSTNVAMSRAMRLMFQSAMLALGAWLAINQEISAGTIVAASIIMARALSPVEQSVSQWPAFTGFRESLKRLKEVFAATADATSDPLQLPEPKGRLVVTKLSAYAPGRTKPLVTDVNFGLEPGDALGIIGPSGAGKSTLVRSLVGAWPHVQGDIRIDGAELKQWDPDYLGPKIGYLPQEISLFRGTVAQNISRFYPDARDEAIVAAAQAADIHDMILELPDGYNTEIGEQGAVLSAGQRQRIGLARAIYGEPRLLIMDEPNSNLDTAGEASLVEVIRQLKAAGTTVVVVAHRPSAIATADYVLVVVDGRQVAFGSRDEVMRKYLRPVDKIEAPKRVAIAGAQS